LNFIFHSENLLTNVGVGIILSTIISLISLKFKLLTISGTITTFILALLIYTFGTWQWTLPIVTFFVLSSLLSKFRKKRNKEVEVYFEKSEQRDYLQVLANGGAACLLVIFYYFFEYELLYLFYVSIVASACADTWATEAGTLMKTRTIDILTLKKINQGVSGGVSLPGTMASIAGAVVIAAVSSFWFDKTNFLIVTFAGFAGSIADSFYGSLFQAQYECRVCKKVTEKKNHCNEDAVLIKGKRWLNNDTVNFGAGVSGGLFSVFLFSFVKG